MSELGRYRKIHVKMWSSADFLSLSAPKPNARDLFIHLQTGPHTTAIPGLFSSGPAALAEALGWPLMSWKRCFYEIEKRGMAAADWNAKLVYLPGALAHNRPTNPNVVHAWRDTWLLLPSCPLKARAEEDFGASMTGTFHEAWAYVTRNVPRKVPGGFGTEPSGDSSGNTLSRTHARAQAAPAPVPVLRSEGVQGGPVFDAFGARVRPETEPADPSARLSWLAVDFTHALNAATARSWPAVPPFPAESAALEWFYADACHHGASWATLPKAFRAALDIWFRKAGKFVSHKPSAYQAWAAREDIGDDPHDGPVSLQRAMQ